MKTSSGFCFYSAVFPPKASAHSYPGIYFTRYKQILSKKLNCCI